MKPIWRAGGLVFLGLLSWIPFVWAVNHPTHQPSPAVVAPNADVDQLIKRSDSLVARKLFDDAIEVLKQCIELSPRDATLYNRLGVAYHRKQDFRDAEVNYKKAIKLNPVYAEAYNNLGTIAFTQKKYGRAVKYYEKALKIRPEAATTHYNLGSAFFSQQKYDKAFTEYQLALKMDPDLIEHISATGSMVRTAAFNQSKYHFYMAKIFALMGDNNRAIDYLTRAFEEGFKETDLLYNDKAFATLIKDEKFSRLIQNPPKPIE
ncbi:MAG: tetratricopeptide repeat protein [Acidobacteriia bacterium]|nr:tetratricopeptide repeat protein [Terriglobia bacterium]